MRQDRALSVAGQEVLHRSPANLCAAEHHQDASNMFLRLNDIVGAIHETALSTAYQVVKTPTFWFEKRLKFLYAASGKHQRRMISYSGEFSPMSAKSCRLSFAPENSESVRLQVAHVIEHFAVPAEK